MSDKLNLTGKSAGEFYTITFPDNLIKFISFDFEPFIEKCTELCGTSMQSGIVNHDEISLLRKSILHCHRYYEKNMRSIFDKIVIDFWIDYICRVNEITASTLWGSYFTCRNEFELTLFKRLCDFRYNRSINRWINLMQTLRYAKQKTEFVFGKVHISKAERNSTAMAKSGYFDLIFNVAANEMGCGDISANKVYTGMRAPNSPFIMNTMSRDILQKVLSGFGVAYNYKPTVSRGEFTADKEAMDVFEAISSSIPSELGSMVGMNSILRSPQKVYVPESFKAVIDLEIDALLESGAVLQKCGRCAEFFRRDSDYDYDYCSRVDEYGKSCLDLINHKNETKQPEVDLTVLQSRCDQLYKEMAARVNVDINQRDFSDWYKYMVLIRENVTAGKASMDDFENFAEYSRTISFASSIKQNDTQVDPAKVYVKADSTLPSRDKSGREIRPFEFERVERTPLINRRIPDITAAELAKSLPPIKEVPYTVPKTARIIRGVVPTGVKELPEADKFVNELATAPASKTKPLIEPEFEQELHPVQKIIKEIVQNKASQAESNIEAEQFTNTAEFEPLTPAVKLESPKPSKPSARLEMPKQPAKIELPKPTAKQSKPKTKNKTAKSNKQSLLQNPYIRSLIDVNDTAADTVTLPTLPHLSGLIDSDDGFADSADSKPKSALAATAATPKSPLLDFAGILSGLERSDGFDVAEDENGISHKTSRVMDAVLGNSKIVNPFLKQDDTDL